MGLRRNNLTFVNTCFMIQWMVYFNKCSMLLLLLSHSVVSDSLRPNRRYSPTGSSVHGILQAKILEWVAMPSSRGSSQPRAQTQVSHIAGGFQILHCLSHQGSPWILEQAAYPFSRGSSWPRNWTGVFCTAGGFFTSWSFREAQVKDY